MTRRHSAFGNWKLAPNGRDYTDCRMGHRRQCCATVKNDLHGHHLKVECSGRLRFSRTYPDVVAAMRVGSTMLTGLTWKVPVLSPALRGQRKRCR